MRIADSHNDLLMAVHHLRERGHSDPFGDFWLPQLKTGGVSLQILPIYTEEQYAGDSALRRCLLLLDEAFQLAEAHADDVVIVLGADDLRAALDSDRIALIPALEGTEPVGPDLGILSGLFRAGIRMASMTWNRRTMMADGVGEQDAGGRLTSLGVASIAEMERTGMILDISHLSEEGFWHVAEVATKPFVASHSSARAVYDHPRNLSDDQLRAVASSGGFVSVNCFGGFIHDEPTIDRLLDHVEHLAGVIGFDRIGLGPDFIVDVGSTVDPILTGALVDISEWPVIPDLVRPADLPVLAEALVARFGRENAEWVANRTMTEFLLSALPASGSLR